MVGGRCTEAGRGARRGLGGLGGKVRANPGERASVGTVFTFFLGGLAVFEGEERVGAVGVSGWPGEVDEELAQRAA